MKKRIFILFLIVPLVLAGCSEKKETLANLSEVTLAQSQQLITGQVKSIAGNEIVLDVGTYRTMQRPAGTAASGSNANGTQNSGGAALPAASSGRTGSGSQAGASASPNFNLDSNAPAESAYVSGNSYGGSRLSSSYSVTFTDQNGNAVNSQGGNGNFGGGNFSGGNFGSGSGSFPSGAPSGMPSGMPSDFAGGAPAFNGNGSQGGSNTGSGQAANSSESNAAGSSGRSTRGIYAGGTGSFGSGSASRFQSSGQTMNLTIPVGTQVLMSSNGALTVTTFGRVQADDIIEIILQTDTGGTQTVLRAQIMG